MSINLITFSDFLEEEAKLSKALFAPKVPSGYRNLNPRKENEVNPVEIEDWAREFEWMISKHKRSILYFALLQNIRSKGLEYFYNFINNVWLPRLEAAKYPQQGTEDMVKFNSAWVLHYIKINTKLKSIFHEIEASEEEILKWITSGKI